MFGYVIGIAISHTGWLPAHEMAHRILAQAVDAVEVCSPLGTGNDRYFTYGTQGDAGGGVPYVILFIDPALALPSGVPFGIVVIAADIDVQVHPITGRRDFEFAIALDVRPITAQEKFHYIPVPKFQPVPRIVSGQPEIQFGIRTDEQEIQVGVSPEAADFGFELRVIELMGAVFYDPGGRGALPR